jgi:hypothetical protein
VGSAVYLGKHRPECFQDARAGKFTVGLPPGCALRAWA